MIFKTCSRCTWLYIDDNGISRCIANRTEKGLMACKDVVSEKCPGLKR